MASYKINIIFTTLLLCCIKSSAQDITVNSINSHFNHYQQTVLAEKIFLHSDRDFYLAGEIIWFKLYYMEANWHTPLDISKLAYVEVIDKNQHAILQTKISLNNGSGNGSLYIPVSLPSGMYKIRAYTNWMKNFGADYFFEKPLTIVNSLKSPELQPAANSNYDLQFFPEGGNLVENIACKTAFRMVDKWGKGVSCNGVILSNRNDTVAQLTALKFGMGNFIFTPTMGNRYRAVIKLADTVLVMPLPEVYKSGYVLGVNDTDSTTLTIKVYSSLKTLESSYLFIHNRGQLQVADKILLKDGFATVNINKKKLREGISSITLLNSERMPVCERLFFIPPVTKLIIASATDKVVFAPREKVSISLSSSDETAKTIAADMSLAVFSADTVLSTESADISSYAWLSSELRGTIESPGFYFSNDIDAAKAADNLMLTQGWRRFTWQNMITGQLPAIDFLPEWQGHIITGKLTAEKTGLSAKDIPAFLSVPGSRVWLYCAPTDTAGIVHFYTKNLQGNNEMVLQTDSRSDTGYRLEMLTPFSEKHSSAKLPIFSLDSSIKNNLLDNSIVMQVQNSFNGERLKQFGIPDTDSTAFFGKPDHEYLLDNFTRFTTMEEVLREYVSEIQVRRQKDNFRLITANGPDKIFMDNPLTLLNGVPVFDVNKVMKYNPLKVRKIEVVNRKYYYGPLAFNGIVNFTTYNPDPAILSDAHALVADYEGMQLQREFYAPRYETPEQIASRRPDFRNVLYWLPNLTTDASGKTNINFYTSDKKGKYQVVVQGITAEGKTGTKSFGFEVQ
jgi:hypothetical protein